MRLLFIIQRYGREALGGSEHYCREMAERLAERGHEISVLTSCAVDYQGWANEFPPGQTELNGVTVHRFPVTMPRNERFYYLTERAHGAALLGRPLPDVLEDHWMRVVGPTMPEMEAWLDQNVDRFDAVAIVTYQFAHAVRATEVISAHRRADPAARRHPPIVLHPTAHEDVTLGLGVFDNVFSEASGLVFLTPEERDLVRLRFGSLVADTPAIVSGVGVPAASMVTHDQRASFRTRHGIGDAPFALCVGRMDENKGFIELARAFERFKLSDPGPLKLVLVGGGDLGGRVKRLSSDNVRFLGRVSDEDRDAALSEATVFIHPSLFESFSIVVCEAWCRARPVLVRNECAVLRGQVERSGGGLSFAGQAEFEVMLQAVVSDPKLSQVLGESGAAYVERNYRWDTLLHDYEVFVEALIQNANASDATTPR